MKKIKVFTYLDRPSSPFLNLWINYYRKIDNVSLSILRRNYKDDFDNAKYHDVEVINVDNFFKDSVTKKEWVPPNIMFNYHQKKFLENFDVVIYADCDEFIVHENLNELLNKDFKNPLVTTGIDIIQNLDTEEKFNFDNSILSQRNYMIRNNWYDKPIIVNSETTWRPGRHNNSTISYEKYIENLYLIHLGRMCFSLFFNSWEETKRLYPLTSNRINNSRDGYYCGKLVTITDDIKKLIEKIL